MGSAIIHTIKWELQIEVWVILHNHEVVLLADTIQRLFALQRGDIADRILAIGDQI